jgi:hypothetical protein
LENNSDLFLGLPSDLGDDIDKALCWAKGTLPKRDGCDTGEHRCIKFPGHSGRHGCIWGEWGGSMEIVETKYTDSELAEIRLYIGKVTGKPEP